MGVKKIIIDPIRFSIFIKEFRDGLYDEEISKEILVREQGFEKPVDVALIYLVDKGVAIIPFPPQSREDVVSHYYLVEDVPFDTDNKPDYRIAFHRFMKETGALRASHYNDSKLIFKEHP